VIQKNVRNEVPSGSVICGVRPEDIEISDNDLNAHSLIVRMIEPLGAETLIYGRVGTTEMTLRTPGAVNLEAGDEIHVKFPPASLHYFDPKTQRRYS